MRKLLIIFLIVSFSACASIPKNYAGIGKSNEAVPFPNGALTGTLANGLRYYILENNEGSAYISLAVNLGSADEKENQRGFAKFVSGIIAEGLKGSDGFDFSSGLENTVYSFNTGQNPSSVLKKLNNIFTGDAFTTQNVESVRRQIEAQNENDLRPLSFAFAGSPLQNALRSPQIESAKTQDLIRFYSTWYRPDNAALIIVGDFDSDALLQEVTEMFTMPAGRRPFDRTVYELVFPQKNTIKIDIQKDPSLSENAVTLFYLRKPYKDTNTLQDFRMNIDEQIVSEVLANRMSSISNAIDTPFGQEIKDGLLFFGQSSRLFKISFGTKPGRTAEALRMFLAEKNNLIKHGLTDAEIASAKKYLLDKIDVLSNEVPTSSGIGERFLKNYQSQEIASSNEWYCASVRILLPQITKGEINKTLKSYFAPNDLSAYFLNLPAEPDVTVQQLGGKVSKPGKASKPGKKK